MISKSKITDIVKKIEDNYYPDKVILFGSYANGTANEDSDLDFIIIKNTQKPKQRRGIEVRQFLLGSMVPIDLKIYTPKEFENELKSDYSFLNKALENSLILYERKD